MPWLGPCADCGWPVTTEICSSFFIDLTYIISAALSSEGLRLLFYKDLVHHSFILSCSREFYKDYETHFHYLSVFAVCSPSLVRARGDAGSARVQIKNSQVLTAADLRSRSPAGPRLPSPVPSVRAGGSVPGEGGMLRCPHVRVHCPRHDVAPPAVRLD